MLEIVLKRDSFRAVEDCPWGAGAKAEAEATVAATRRAEVFMLGKKGM